MRRIFRCCSSSGDFRIGAHESEIPDSAVTVHPIPSASLAANIALARIDLEKKCWIPWKYRGTPFSQYLRSISHISTWRSVVKVIVFVGGMGQICRFLGRFP